MIIDSVSKNTILHFEYSKTEYNLISIDGQHEIIFKATVYLV